MKIKNMISKNRCIVIILLIAVFLRFYKLGSIPPHLTPDEASLGYNAYSILKTGRDEYGEILPLIFKAFGEFKLGLYIYLTVPFVAVFGLNEWAVRLPSALAGVLSIYLIYLIIGKFFRNSKLSANFAALILAINPWHIHLSMGAWEVNVSLFLTLCGIYLFLQAFDGVKNKFFLIPSSISFALTLLAYQGAKLSTLTIVLVLAILYRRKILSFDKKVIFVSMVLGLIVIFPVVASFFQGKTGRLSVFSVFSYPRSEAYLKNILDQASVNRGSLVYNLFYSEPLNFGRAILGRWFNHFSARFLFFEGDWQNPRHSAPNHGMLLLTDLIFLVLGFYALAKKGVDKATLFFVSWLILAPLPAVLSRDQVQAVRAFNTLVPLTVITATGVCWFWGKFKKLRFLPVFLYLISFIYFLDAYFVHLPIHSSRQWSYGYREMVKLITPIQQKFEIIKIQQSYEQPYIYFLFYQKYPPEKYQEQARLKESEYGDVGQIEKLDNIYFTSIDWHVNRYEKGVLFVGDAIHIPKEESEDKSLFNLIGEINYLDGNSAFRAVEVR